jgi:succinoglycan biosynthesis transport protein ExoP
MDRELERSQIRDIIRRRKKGFMILFLLLFFAGLIVALALPPIYKSEAMIRVEDQEIKEGFVQPTTNEYVEERIGKLNQQVLSVSNLKEIVEKFGLYQESDKQIGVSELVGKLREDIQLETIVSEMQSKPGGRPLSFMVAFKLSYEGKDPNTVQKVAETIANLYITEDIKSTERKVSATTDFLKTELERIKKDIEIQEKKISEFKEEHSRELPSDLSNNTQTITRLERELDGASLQLRYLNEKKIFLESQLAQVEPLSPIVVEGEKIATNPNQRLKELNIQLTKLKSIYSDKHPDIKKLKKEIAELESQVQASDDSVEKVKRLRQLENELATAEGKLGPEHPDVKALKNEIALVSQQENSKYQKKSRTTRPILI